MGQEVGVTIGILWQTGLLIRENIYRCNGRLEVFSTMDEDAKKYFLDKQHCQLEKVEQYTQADLDDLE